LLDRKFISNFVNKTHPANGVHANNINEWQSSRELSHCLDDVISLVNANGGWRAMTWANDYYLLYTYIRCKSH
jgi:hypothetical protein